MSIRRIAFLSEHASPVALLGSVDAGGQNVYVDEVSRNLALRGYAVDVFTRRDNPEAPTVIDWAPGVRVINLAAGPAEPRLKDELWPFMPAFRDAFLHFMEHDEARYDLIHGNFWMSGWVATELRRWLNLPVVQIFHAMGKTKQRHQGSADSSPQERISVESQVIQHVDRIIAQCPSEQSELVDDYDADPGKVVVIPSAVNTEVFCPVARAEARRYTGLEPDDFVIVYVGRMQPRKDVRNVVRATARLVQWCAGMPSLPTIKLLLVGGETVEPDPVATPEIGELQRLAAECGITEHVHFIGKRQQDTLRYFYSAGDVAVTTPWYEPFGLTPLEAMACGRPIIGSAVGGITYTIAAGETGFLVPPRDPETLAARLHQLLMEPEMRERMGRAARLRMERKFTWSTVAMSTSALYETLLAPTLSGREEVSKPWR
ncbi:MAG: glycosyltransferase [Chloroflexi bacterium]|nr:glycosyltransferase [Chloroflexota bacterium]